MGKTMNYIDIFRRFTRFKDIPIFLEFAVKIDKLFPESREKTIAMEKLEQSYMWFCASERGDEV